MALKLQFFSRLQLLFYLNLKILADVSKVDIVKCQIKRNFKIVMKEKIDAWLQKSVANVVAFEITLPRSSIFPSLQCQKNLTVWILDLMLSTLHPGISFVFVLQQNVCVQQVICALIFTNQSVLKTHFVLGFLPLVWVCTVLLRIWLSTAWVCADVS
jgi:hypothetical protein